MYVDKPMHGHGLMQAIARVNRVFKDKPGGLVVDYLGLADDLRKALIAYTESGGRGKVEHDQSEAILAMRRRYEDCLGLFRGFDWSAFSSGSAAERVSVLPRAQEHVLRQENGKQHLFDAVYSLSRAFALAVPSDEAMAIIDDVAFFQAVRAVLAKAAHGGSGAREDLDHAIRQIVSRAVASDEIIDVFAAAGLKKPDISILSDDFLAEVKEMPERNLAVELLAKLLKGEIKARSRRNVVESRSFEKMLDEAVRRYQNRAVETAQVIEELIALARDMRARDARGEQLGLSDDELAFYDALGVNDSAVAVLGDETLRDIARELVATVKANVKIDWTVREDVRAQLRVFVKRCLKRHGYPPDKQAKATITVLEQAEVLSEHWVAA
jgi:type I restriction enzyme R subunit